MCIYCIYLTHRPTSKSKLQPSLLQVGGGSNSIAILSLRGLYKIKSALSLGHPLHKIKYLIQYFWELLKHLPNMRLSAYPKGAWHQTKPKLKTTSAVPLMYPPPTHVAVIVKMPTNIPMFRPANIVSSWR